ncbi:unnamed protein product [Prorocentrum cordatum]|nr:unnamed protein product [Polarella glacialis]
MDGHDAGGSANVCGYAVEVKIVATTGYDFSEPSWIATKGIPTAHTDNLRTPYDCRMLCMSETGCAFFAFDALKQPGKGFCVLKQSYDHPSCVPQYGEDDDIASGPAYCGSADTCGVLRSYYQVDSCCAVASTTSDASATSSEAPAEASSAWGSSSFPITTAVLLCLAYRGSGASQTLA